jgi:hypothetical protein
MEEDVQDMRERHGFESDRLTMARRGGKIVEIRIDIVH